MSDPARTTPSRDELRRSFPELTRRAFLGTAGAAAALAAAGRSALPAWAAPGDVPAPAPATRPSEPESLVKVLYGTLTAAQKKAVCFDWDYKDKEKGLLRTRVENNWQITKPALESAFYTPEQRSIVRSIFEGMLQPEWVKKIDQQLKDDIGGFGKRQGIALFGNPDPGSPGAGKFEFVITSRHLTLRCDGNSAEHVAFGGPIMHGHAPCPGGIHEKKDHPGNIFWPQAVEANRLYTMLDGKQRDLALVKTGMPDEDEVAFRGKGPRRPSPACR